MIRHIVMFSCKDPADVDAVLRGLSVLTQIPHARVLEVSRNEKIDQLANDIDVVVYGEFDTIEDFRAYQAHTLNQDSIRQVRHLRDVRMAADYSVENAVRAPVSA
jgi:hypothetical protein